jgi:hypothetical protein
MEAVLVSFKKQLETSGFKLTPKIWSVIRQSAEATLTEFVSQASAGGKRQTGYRVFYHARNAELKEEKMDGSVRQKTIPREWKAFTEEEKAVWNQKAGVKPKKTTGSKRTTGWNVYFGHQMAEQKGNPAEERLSIKDISAQWKAMDEEEKETWNAQGTAGVPKAKSKSSKPMTGWNLYFGFRMAQSTKEHPINGSIASESWKKMSEEEQTEWKEKAKSGKLVEEVLAEKGIVIPKKGVKVAVKKGEKKVKKGKKKVVEEDEEEVEEEEEGEEEGEDEDK